MGRGSEFQELGIAQAQTTAAKSRLANKDGFNDQQRHMRFYLAELLSGSLLCFLLFGTLVLLITDRSLALYAAGATAITGLTFVGLKVWKKDAIGKKRAEDLRRVANDKDNSDTDTEAKDA